MKYREDRPFMVKMMITKYLEHQVFTKGQTNYMIENVTPLPNKVWEFELKELEI